MSARTRAFTLVELLVVIAVVALLMGVLLPVLGSVRTTSRAAAGASNIRQLQIANGMYADDHAEHFLPGAIDMQFTNLHRWHGTRDNPSAPFEPEDGPITPYLDSEAASAGVRACPAFVPPDDLLRVESGAFEANCGGYGYNLAYVGQLVRQMASGLVSIDDDAGAKRTGVRRPTQTLAFADCAFAGRTLIEYSFAEPPRWVQLPTFRRDPSIHFRHDGRANIVWLDGHVSAERMDFTWSSGLYPLDPADWSIGWFGDVETNTTFGGRR
jgi:prepilin-type processing-associated H-X9-DG protein/prepilin-type N-terminal cleavage/methylation domain-containing protein